MKGARSAFHYLIFYHNLPPNMSNEKIDLAGKRLLLAAGLVLLLLLMQLACNLFPDRGAWWGFFHLSFLPGWQQALLVTLSLAAAVAGGLLSRAAFIQASWTRTDVILMAALSLLLTVSFYIFKVEHFLLGDAFYLTQGIGKSIFELSPDIGTIAAHRLLYRLFSGNGFTGIDVYRLLSVTTGILYLGMACWWALKNNRSRDTAWLSFFSFLTPGLFLLFWGYAENYALLNLILMLFLLTALVSFESGNWILPGMVLGLAIFLHLSALSLVPGYLLLLFFLHQDGKLKVNKILLVISGLLCVLLLAAGIIYLVKSYKGFAFLIALSKSQQRPYSLFSPGHLRDIANGLALNAPFALILFFTSGMRRLEKPVIFLLFLTVCCLGGISLIDIAFESADWDLMAFVSGPILLLGLVAVSSNIKQGRAVFLSGLALSVFIFHSLPWIISNHSLDISVKQFAQTAQTYRHQPKARMFYKGMMDLMTVPGYERYDKAVWLGEYALARGFKDPQLYFNCGLAYYDLGQTGRAVDCWDSAAALYPKYQKKQEEVYFYLALSLLRSGDPLTSAMLAEKGLALKARRDHALSDADTRLAVLAFTSLLETDAAGAREFYRRTSVLPVPDPSFFLETGSAAALRGNFPLAKEILLQGKRTFPGDPAVKKMLNDLPE